MDFKISTPEDFRRIAETRNLGPEEPLTLPSGLTVLARRPTPVWWVINRGVLPARLAAQVLGVTAPTDTSLSDTEKLEYAKFITKLFDDVVTQPKIRLNPQAGEIDPWLVDPTDVLAIIAFAGGETEADRQGLDTFRGKPEPVNAGDGGEPVALSSESAVGA